MPLKISHLIIFFLVGYFLFGISLSAVPGVSKLGFVFAFLGSLLCCITMLMRHEGLPKVWKIYTIFYVYILFSFAWNPSPNVSFGVVASGLTVYFSVLLIALSLHLNVVSITTLIIISFIPGVVTFVAYILDINYVTEIYDLSQEAARKRFGGFVGHPNAMVSRVMLPLFLAIFFAPTLMKSKVYTLYLFPISCLLGVFAVYASGSKKALLFLIISIPLIVSFYPKVRRIVPILFVSSLIGGAMAIGYLSQINLSDSNWEVLVRVGLFLDGGDSTSERVWMVYSGLNIFVNSIFFGEGLNSFSYLSGLGYYSHNNLIELLVSGGLLAAFLYYGVFIVALYYSAKEISLFFSLGILILFLAFDLTSVSYIDRGIQPVFAILLLVFFPKNIKLR